MTYILTWSDSSLKPTPITLANNAISSNSISITLTGKGAVNWGQPLQQNLMHLLENFASNGTAPSYATIGQLWYNAATKHLNLNTSTGWSELAFRHIDSATPPNPPSYSGDTWYDTTNHFLNVYNSAGSGSWNRLAYSAQAQGNYSIEQAGSAANAYVIALNPPITVYANNFSGAFKVSHANTGACTINAGGGAVQLRNPVGNALVSGDLQIGQVVSYIYVLGDNAAYITATTQSQTDVYYARLAGSSTQIFNVANATPATYNAINISQADGRYATLAGLVTQVFSAANAVAGNNVINIAQADGRYAALAGLGTQVFSVATATPATNNAINITQADTRYAGILGVAGTFDAANAVTGNNVINITQADVRYAALAGKNTQVFSVATATPATNNAINITQADSRYAALAGLGTQVFSVATATPATNNAINITQADSRYLSITGIAPKSYNGLGTAWVVYTTPVGRAGNTVYTNVSPYPIIISVASAASGGTGSMVTGFVNGVQVANAFIQVVGGAASITFVVPSGATYYATFSYNGGIWAEYV